MSQNMVTVNGVEVAASAAQPTHISIHIHQESALAQLLKAGSSLKEFFSRPRDPGPSKTQIRYTQLSIGVAQILLGVLSCVLGGLLYFGPWIQLRGSGCAFWVGAVMIAAGGSILVHEKHRGQHSAWASGLLNLAGVAAAVAAVVFCVYSLTWQSDGFYTDSVCDRSAPENTTPQYRYHWQRYSSLSWDEEQCKMYMQMLVNMFLGIRIMLLVVCVLQILLGLAFLALGLRSLCARDSSLLDEEGAEKKLLGENSAPPSPSKEKATAAIIL